jgi:hypothetical protein
LRHHDLIKARLGGRLILAPIQVHSGYWIWGQGLDCGPSRWVRLLL